MNFSMTARGVLPGWVALMLGISLMVGGATSVSAQVIPLFTNRFSQTPVNRGDPDGTGAWYGFRLASAGNGSVIVSGPKITLPRSAPLTGFQSEAGSVFLYSDAGSPVGSAGQAGVNSLRRNFGFALSVFPDGRFLVGTRNSRSNTSGVFLNVGSVQLQGPTGGTWQNPNGPTDQNGFFGDAVAALGGNRFAAATQPSVLLSKVYIFDAATPGGNPLVTIPNPTPPSAGKVERFGYSMSALGTNRMLVTDPNDSANLGDEAGSVFIYDLNGNRLSTIHNFTGKPDFFGGVVVQADEHRFLVSAPFADVIYSQGGQLFTNLDAGKVYLYDDTGAVLKTFVAPNPAVTRNFGQSVAMLGGSRLLIGASGEQVGAIVGAGMVHLFNLDGLHLESVANPEPGANDLFGSSVAGVTPTRFVVGAPFDDTLRTDAGCIYGFSAPLPIAELGAEIPRPPSPPNNLDLSGTFSDFGPTVTPAGAAFWHVPSQKLYAVRPGDVLVTWRLQNPQNVNPPPIYNYQASIVWPTNEARFQVHVAGSTPVDVGDKGSFSTAVLHATTTDAVAQTVADTRVFAATRPGDSLLMLSKGNPASNAIAFQLVRTIDARDVRFLHDNVPALVGEPVIDPGPYHDSACGGPQVVTPAAVFCPAIFDVSTRIGTIVPVNRDSPANPDDDLIVAYYQRGTKLVDPATGQAVSNGICWAHKPVRYAVQWPVNAPHLIIASQLGTGPLSQSQFVDWQLYVQNNPALPGFNPNDEHALRRSVSGGDAVFALRDDLATAGTSEPFVLVLYKEPAGGALKLKLWQVVAEEAPFFFRYPAQAGVLLQPPFPLGTLALVQESRGVSGPFFRDRKLSFWARAAGDDGGLAEIVMRYFYPMQPEFFFPGANPPQPGVSVPWLALRSADLSTPVDVHYDVRWPDEVPELRVGETLVKPKNGLPQIAGQSSVEILYDQAAALGKGAAARLIDPLRIRSVALTQLPADVATRNKAGLIYFSSLPPHLEDRVSYDPVARRLQWLGKFVEPPAGESYLLLNVMTPRDRAALDKLTVDPGWRVAVANLATLTSTLVDVPADSKGFDSLALTAGDAKGTGYLSLAFGNSTNLSAPSDPVSVSIIKVTCPLYRGELKVIESLNPLAEQLTLRHSGDFGGRPQEYVFEWRTLPPVDGLPSTRPPEQWDAFPADPTTGVGASEITISGPGLYTLSDNYFVARYRRVVGADSPCGAGFSDWTAPMLGEGWIKRVLAGIGPFEQRVKDYQDTQVNTIVSMISQAGSRAVGDVALNLDAVNQAGLIEVYETVLRRGMALSVEGVPAVDYPPANDALLLVAGRLAELYMLLGNEAYADAADPTIAIGTDDAAFGAQATSLHCFMNQTRSLLEEELALLRGRDNSKLPSVQTHPVYNRLIWNFTRDITGGEVAYALNYNIRDADGDVAGTINEADAKRLYPQGHGDAWGHYLTAIKNYYRLLRNANFTWVPRIEAVIVGGVPVSVDFLDERKFAAAAAARARSGAELVSLVFRESYEENSAKPWQEKVDTDISRAWGTSDWGSRAGQGALFDWVVGNALLPETDTNPSHTGIQKIDRTTVRELGEIVEHYAEIQQQVDRADAGLNPLGLASTVVPFDIDPGGIAAGKTHFEQVNERANEALKNALAVFNHANASTQLLRKQADEVSQFTELVVNREADFNNRLIEIFGTPYSDDIGPTGTYPTGYAGPDLYHFDYLDSPEIRVGVTGQQSTLSFRLTELEFNPSGAMNRKEVPVTFHFSKNGFGLQKPAFWAGQRAASGEIQLARNAFVEALRRLERGVTEYENLVDSIEDASGSLQAEFKLNASQVSLRQEQLNRIQNLNERIEFFRSRALTIRYLGDQGKSVLDAAVEALPDIVGLATDAFSVYRATTKLAIDSMHRTLVLGSESMEANAAGMQDEKGEVAALTELKLVTAQVEFSQLERIRQLEQLIRGEPAARLEMAALRESVSQATGRYQSAVARGLRLMEERLRFRQQTAAQVQTFRYKDMAFRVFRSDALQKYRAQFDLAARYAYLAAKAYDYETCLAPGDSRGPGSNFLTPIIRSRSLGRFSNGLPLAGSGNGDPGLADPLARMNANWSLVLKGQLGFNNPQTETGRFSLRNELFRILTGPSGTQRWRETLSKYVVPNLLDMPEFQRHCIPFAPTQPVEPAIVIPFSTMVNFGLNFFGWPAGGGDNDYDSTKFATKIRSVGVWFANYNNLGGGMINTPRVYLVPVGLDVMRSPTQGNPIIREWRVLDQALPVPFPLNGNDLSDPTWIPGNDTLSEEFAAIRRFGRFRAFHDSGNFNPAETISDSRLIGRSVWNTRWLLIIPGGTLHTDRNEGIQRFINGGLKGDGTRDGNGVADIRIFFQTYAYPGN